MNMHITVKNMLTVKMENRIIESIFRTPLLGKGMTTIINAIIAALKTSNIFSFSSEVFNLSDCIW